MPDDATPAGQGATTGPRRQGALRRLAFLGPRDAWILAQALVALPLVGVTVRRLGLRRVLSFLGRRNPAPAAALDTARRDRLAWIVRVAAGRAPWRPNCLQRSVVLWWLLRREGYPADVRIGVRRNRETGELEFHAWIELLGAALNERPDIRREFATFDRAIAPAGAHFD